MSLKQKQTAKAAAQVQVAALEAETRELQSTFAATIGDQASAVAAVGTERRQIKQVAKETKGWPGLAGLTWLFSVSRRFSTHAFTRTSVYRGVDLGHGASAAAND